MRHLNRGVVFAVVTVAVLTTMYLWEIAPHPDHTIYPPPDFLGSTWYGPVMLLLIPLSLGWWSLGAKRRYTRVISLFFTLLVLAICVFCIIVSIEFTRPFSLPWPPSGGEVR